MHAVSVRRRGRGLWAEGLLLVGANERNLRCGLGLRLAPRDERRGRRAEAIARGAEGEMLLCGRGRERLHRARRVSAP